VSMALQYYVIAVFAICDIMSLCYSSIILIVAYYWNHNIKTIWY
jgi:hypothetical protein